LTYLAGVRASLADSTMLNSSGESTTMLMRTGVARNEVVGALLVAASAVLGIRNSN
jgi:hypothetical protein